MIDVQRGYDDTYVPLFVVLLVFWGTSLPLSYTLMFEIWITEPLGAPGFWIALIVGLICAAVMLTLRMFKFKLEK